MENQFLIRNHDDHSVLNNLGYRKNLFEKQFSVRNHEGHCLLNNLSYRKNFGQ